VRKQLISLALLALMPLAVQAQDEEEDSSGFNWNVAATSEYMFRGISQTDDHPAFQAGAGYSWQNGFYAGLWQSDVDFGSTGDDDTQVEIDAFIGWNGDLGATNLDVQLVRYNYIGEPVGANYAYNELIGKLTFAENYTATLGYTNDYLNSDTDSFYAGFGGEWEVGGGVNLGASVGYTTFDNDLSSDNGYLDYSVGANRDFGPVNVGLSYIGTDNKAENFFGKDNSEDKVVLTFSFEG
jgi:uncharacterized protein (TIGR02001 family)